MAGHVPMATVLDFGLARFRCGERSTLALPRPPGGTLHFAGNQLQHCHPQLRGRRTARYRAQRTRNQLAHEARQHADLRHNLDQLERPLIDRLWHMEPR